MWSLDHAFQSWPTWTVVNLKRLILWNSHSIFLNDLSELCTDARRKYSLSLSLLWLALFPLCCDLYKNPMSTIWRLYFIEIHWFRTHRCFTVKGWTQYIVKVGKKHFSSHLRILTLAQLTPSFLRFFTLVSLYHKTFYGRKLTPYASNLDFHSSLIFSGKARGL